MAFKTKVKRERFPELRILAEETAGVSDNLSPDMLAVALATAEDLYEDLKQDYDFGLAC